MRSLLFSVFSMFCLCAPTLAAEPVIRADLAVAEDGSLAATSNADGTLLVWNTSDWSLALRHDGGERVFGYDFAPDNRFVAFGARDGRAVVLDLDTGLRVFEVQDRQQSVNAVRFGPGDRLYAAGEGRNLTVYDWRRAEKLATLDLGADALVEDFAVVPGGEALFVARFDEQARLIDADTGELLHSWRNAPRKRDGRRNVKSVEVSPDGETGFYSGVNGSVFAVDLVSGARLGSVQAHPDFVSAMDLSPDGSLLAANDLDGNTTLIDAETLEVVARLTQDASFASRRLLFAVSFLGDRERLVTGGIRLPLIEWKVASREQTVTIATTPDASLHPPQGSAP